MSLAFSDVCSYALLPGAPWRTNHMKALLPACLFFALFGCEPRTTPSQKSPELTVSASQLYQDYIANVHSADARYRNRIIAVYGSVREIMRHAVLIEPAPGQIKFTSISCQFRDTSQLGSLHKGDQVTIV